MPSLWNSLIALIKSLVAPLSVLSAFFSGKRHGVTKERLEQSEKAAQAAAERIKSDARIDAMSDADRKRLRDKWNPLRK